jgi:hypothetical protein
MEFNGSGQPYHEVSRQKRGQKDGRLSADYALDVHGVWECLSKVGTYMRVFNIEGIYRFKMSKRSWEGVQKRRQICRGHVITSKLAQTLQPKNSNTSHPNMEETRPQVEC